MSLAPLESSHRTSLAPLELYSRPLKLDCPHRLPSILDQTHSRRGGEKESPVFLVAVPTRAVRIAPFSNRLAHVVPSNIQDLRCLTNYEALRFSQHIRTLAERMVDRMITNSSISGGKYISVHLRFEEDMVAFSCCTYDGGEEEQREMDIARERSWRGKFRKHGRIIRPGANRMDGKCPLTSLEKQMLDRGRGECNPGNINNESNQTSRPLSGQEKRSMYKLVERDGLFLEASDDEVTEVDHILAEPRIEDFVDAVLNFESEDTGIYLVNEGFPCHLDCHQLKAGTEVQGLKNIIGVVKEDPEADFLDGMLQAVDDVHHQNAVEDYLLDSEFSEKVLDYAPCERHHLRNLNSDSYSESLNKRGRVVEMPKLVLCATSIQESSSYPNALDKMTICELQKKFRSTFGRETSVEDKEWLKRRILFGLQNNTEWDSVSCFLRSDISSSENEGNLKSTCSEDSSGRGYQYSTDELIVKTKQDGKVKEKDRSSCNYVSTASSFRSQSGGHGLLSPGDREGISLTQKRSRIHTARCVEESLDLKSRTCIGKLDVSVMNSRGSFRRARSHNRKRRKGLGATPFVYGRDESRGFSIQVPFAPLVWNRPSRKHVSILEHDSKDTKNDLAPSPQESEDDLSDDVTRSRSKNSVSQRKHHKVWSLSEVHKLVDGVSQYGVGRWTRIKNTLFSASAHRTSVDLKDKWRNLLRASDVQLHSKRKVANGRKHPKLSIPTTVLQRVRELADIYPYPRERNSKLARHVPASTSATCSDSSGNCSRRVVGRKSPV